MSPLSVIAEEGEGLEDRADASEVRDENCRGLLAERTYLRRNKEEEAKTIGSLRKCNRGIIIGVIGEFDFVLGSGMPDLFKRCFNYLRALQLFRNPS